jgi:hypothetical protein
MRKPKKREKRERGKPPATGESLWRLNRLGRLRLVDEPGEPIDLRTAALAALELERPGAAVQPGGL